MAEEDSQLRKDYLARIEGRPEPFYGVFFQVAHVENSPASPEPAFRILRAVMKEETMPKAVAFMQKKMVGYGNVLFARYGKPILIARTVKDQVDPAYQARRTREIEDEAYARVEAKDDDFNRLKDLKHDGKNSEVEAIEKAREAEHNAKGWVKYMKKVAEIPESVAVPVGARCEMPTTDGDDFDDDGDDSAAGIDPNKLPDKVVATDGSQAYAACTVMLSDDESMEAVVYVHEVFHKEVDIGSALAPLGLITTPIPVDAFDVGQWIYPVANAWTKEPENESWADKNVHDMQTKRKRDAKAADAKKRELAEQDRQRVAAVKTLAKRVGLSVEDTATICQTMEATEALVACTSINDPVNKEEAVAAVVAKYLNAPIVHPPDTEIVPKPAASAPGPPKKR